MTIVKSVEKKIGFRLIQFLIGVFQGSAEKSNNSEILEVN